MAFNLNFKLPVALALALQCTALAVLHLAVIANLNAVAVLLDGCCFTGKLWTTSEFSGLNVNLNRTRRSEWLPY
jgi:hypothetical protein